MLLLGSIVWGAVEGAGWVIFCGGIFIISGQRLGLCLEFYVFAKCRVEFLVLLPRYSGCSCVLVSHLFWGVSQL